MGNSLRHPVKDIKLDQVSLKSGTVAICGSIQGWREYMEDFYTIQKVNEDTLIAGVFDGHGGPQVACYVSRNLHCELKNDPFFGLKNYYRSLVNTFCKLDEKIISEQGETQLKAIQKQFNSQISKNKTTLGEQVGSTANVLLLTNEKIYVANVGDSRSVLCRNGIAIPLSNDHKPENEHEKDRIKKAGGHVNRGRINSSLNVSRTFGDFYFKSNRKKSQSQQMVISIPEIKQLDRDSHEDQYILIGTDGVWEKYGSNEQQLIDQINAVFVKAENWQEAIKEFLLSLIPDQPVENTTGYDNMTLILVLLNVSRLSNTSSNRDNSGFT